MDSEYSWWNKVPSGRLFHLAWDMEIVPHPEAGEAWGLRTRLAPVWVPFPSILKV